MTRSGFLLSQRRPLGDLLGVHGQVYARRVGEITPSRAALQTLAATGTLHPTPRACNHGVDAFSDCCAHRALILGAGCCPPWRSRNISGPQRKSQPTVVGSPERESQRKSEPDSFRNAQPAGLPFTFSTTWARSLILAEQRAGYGLDLAGRRHDHLLLRHPTQLPGGRRAHQRAGRGAGCRWCWTVATDGLFPRTRPSTRRTPVWQRGARNDPAAPSFAMQCGLACISKADKSINHNKFVTMSQAGDLQDVVFQSTANVRSDGSGDAAWNAAVVTSGNPEVMAQYESYFNDLAARRSVPSNNYHAVRPL